MIFRVFIVVLVYCLFCIIWCLFIVCLVNGCWLLVFVVLLFYYWIWFGLLFEFWVAVSCGCTGVLTSVLTYALLFKCLFDFRFSYVGYCFAWSTDCWLGFWVWVTRFWCLGTLILLCCLLVYYFVVGFGYDWLAWSFVLLCFAVRGVDYGLRLLSVCGCFIAYLLAILVWFTFVDGLMLFCLFCVVAFWLLILFV